MDRRQSLRRKMLLHFSALIIFVVAVEIGRASCRERVYTKV